MACRTGSGARTTSPSGSSASTTAPWRSSIPATKSRSSPMPPASRRLEIFAEQSVVQRLGALMLLPRIVQATADGVEGFGAAGFRGLQPGEAFDAIGRRLD